MDLTPHRTVRRDWLRRQVQKGLVECKRDFKHTDDYACDAAYDFSKTGWLPCRFDEGSEYGDVHTEIVLHAHDFTGNGGSSWVDDEGLIVLYHGYQSYSFRMKEP